MATPASNTNPSPPSSRPFNHHHALSASDSTALPPRPLPSSATSNITNSGPPTASLSSAHSQSQSQNKYRASVDAAGRSAALGAPTPASAGGHGGSASNNWRSVSPGRASTGGGGGGAGGNLGGLRPNSEMLHASQGGPGFQSAETDAIDRWFEDLQTYESTLEEMAAASLDPNFKEELGAIEEWFRVLSEAERTAALYSLLQSSTQMQMRFFITVLQQMARQDPTQAALLSPAPDRQISLETQMEAKLASLGFNSNTPASPAIRQFARQSLGVGAGAPSSAAAHNDNLRSPGLGVSHNNNTASDGVSPAQSTLANQRAKLKASSRTSAPANLLLGAGSLGLGAAAGGMAEGLKSPLWSKEETLRERSPSPRPQSVGTSTHPNGSQSAQPPATASFLRSPNLDVDFNNQLSPLVGGSWASMVNTPLVPMFGKNGETMEQGNFGGVPSPNLGSVDQRLAGWGGSNENGGIVLDDVRKFRRSARISGSGGVSGGALGGMYDPSASTSNSNGNGVSTTEQRANSAATAQRRVQDQLQAVQQLKNMQQSALNLGLGGGILPPPSPNGNGNGGNGGGSRVNASGALSSPGLQQTAMQAQQNWRNANAAHLPPTSPQQGHNNNQHGYNNQQQQGFGGYNNNNNVGGGFSGLASGDAFAQPGGLGVSGLSSPNLNLGSQVQQQAQAQLASLLQLQQQMMQQQQQLQSLANGVGLNIGNNGGLSPALGGGGGNPGLGMGIGGLMSPGGGMGGLGNQLSPRLGGGQGGGGFGLGFGGMPSPRRSPRPHDRSPHLPSSRPLGSRSGAGGVDASGNPQQTPGSGQNPDEALDMSLLGDTPAWLRSLRLHKYTPNFDGVGWREMCGMGDKELEEKGVGALGARRKLLKVFEVVRAKTGLHGGAGGSNDGSSSDHKPSSSSTASSPTNLNVAHSPSAASQSSPEVIQHQDAEEEHE